MNNDDLPATPYSEKIDKSWKVVELSRHPKRPYTKDYLENIFSSFEFLQGDRSFADDAAILSGVGVLKGSAAHKVFFLGHQKGRTTQQKIERSFGMARPEGYRKAMRIMDMAEQFGIPLITFIDTPGAFPGVDAEERGQFHAIAACILKMLECSVPTIGTVIGEGGSGGALAIGVPDRLLMLKNSTYSVISPESCASILWSDPSKAKIAADALKFTSRHIHKLGICDHIIIEPGEGAHSNHSEIYRTLLKSINFHLDELINMTKKDRLAARNNKYRFADQGHFQT